MHITSLTSNILSPTGAPWTLPLGRLVLLTGHNGRGKSAVNHASRLAVAESTDDVNGKTMRDASDLFDLLAPFDGDGELFAHATFDTGVVAAWGTAREGDTVKHPTVELPSEVDPARCLPMRAVSQLFAGDPAAARAEVLRWIDASVTIDEVLVHIPAHLHEVYRTVAKAQPGAEVDKLSAVAEYAAAQVRQLEADATAQDELLAQLGNGLAARPSDAEVAEADNAVTAWTAVHLRAVAYEAAVTAQVPTSAPQASPDPAETFAKLQGERAEALAAIAAWDAHAAPPPGLETIQLRRQVLVGAQDQCPVCGTATGAEHLRHVDTYYAQQVATLTAAGASAAQAAQNAAGWRAALAKIDQSIAHCQWQMSMQAAPVAAPTLAPLPENPGVSAAGAAGSLEGWRALQRARTNTRTAWDQITKARDIAAAKRAEKPTYEQLRDACKAGVGSILGANKARFEARVQVYLPENWKFSLRLEKVLASGEVRSTCQPCLAIDGKPPRAYQSGVQRDGLMVALAMALADAGGAVAKDAKKKGKAKLNAAKFFLIVPGDRSRHPDNLGALMRAWSTFPGQVIIESAERPSGKMPAGWTHIDMDEVVKGWTQAPPLVEVTAEQVTVPTRPDGTSWYYRGESDSYAALTYEQWTGSPERGNLVFIGDDVALAASKAKAAELRASTAAATAALVAPPLPPPPPAAEPSQARSPDVPSASEALQAPPPVEVSSSPASPAEAPPSDDRPLVLPGTDMTPEAAQALLMASYGWTTPKCAQVGPALLVELAKRRAYAARVLVVNPGHVELFDEKGASAGTLRA